MVSGLIAGMDKELPRLTINNVTITEGDGGTKTAEASAPDG